MRSKNKRLHAAYTAAGYTQTSFAEACGVSQPAMSAFESYRTTPSSSTLRRMVLAVADGFTRHRPEVRGVGPATLGYLLVKVEDEERVVDLTTAQAIVVAWSSWVPSALADAAS